MNQTKKRYNKIGILIIFLIVFISSFFLSVGNGVVKLSPREIVRNIFFKENLMYYQIIWNVRLPRTLVAALVGIYLSLSGVILQGIMRNSLAGLNIIDVSSGAGLFALIVLIIFPKYYYLVPMAAFTGALTATLLVYILAWRQGAQPTRLILAGVAVSLIFSAGSNAIMTFYPEKVSGAIGFMVGGSTLMICDTLSRVLFAPMDVLPQIKRCPKDLTVDRQGEPKKKFRPART